MTKKEYLQPQVAETIISINTTILAGSSQFSEDGEEGNAPLNDEDAQTDGYSRRRGGGWFDD